MQPQQTNPAEEKHPEDVELSTVRHAFPEGDRQTLNTIFREQLYLHRTKEARQQRLSRTMLIFHLLITIIFALWLVIVVVSRVRPINELSNWNRVPGGCVISSVRMSYDVGYGGAAAMCIVELKYNRNSTLPTTATALSSVMGPGTKKDEVAFYEAAAASGLTVLACWVEPGNPYRAALNVSEHVSSGAIVLIISICIVLLLELITLFVIVTSGKVVYCACWTASPPGNYTQLTQEPSEDHPDHQPTPPPGPRDAAPPISEQPLAAR